MKWPWVPRSLHEDVVSDLRARLDAAEAERVKLTQTITDMKVAGGTIPRMAGVPGGTSRQEPREKDDFEKEIERNPRISTAAQRRHWSSWASDEYRKGELTPAEILERIRGFGTLSKDDVEEWDDIEDAVIG